MWIEIWGYLQVIYLMASISFVYYLAAQESKKHDRSVRVFLSLIYRAGYLGKHSYREESLNKTKSRMFRIGIVTAVVFLTSLYFMVHRQ